MKRLFRWIKEFFKKLFRKKYHYQTEKYWDSDYPVDDQVDYYGMDYGDFGDKD